MTARRHQGNGDPRGLTPRKASSAAQLPSLADAVVKEIPLSAPHASKATFLEGAGRATSPTSFIRLPESGLALLACRIVHSHARNRRPDERRRD
jgi:hypothetical protein